MSKTEITSLLSNMNIRQLPALFYIPCFLLCFVSGWMLRGVFDKESENVTGLSSLNAEQESVIIIREVPEAGDRNKAGLDEMTPRGLSVISGNEEVQVGVHQNFVNELVKHIQSRQFQAAFQLLSRVDTDSATVFDDEDIDQIGSAFLLSIMEPSLDDYVGSELLLSMGEKISALDDYSPYAQFFRIIAKTSQNPEVALSDFDALSSYYQEQISESQLNTLEDWMLDRIERNFYATQDWQGLEQWYSILIARTNEPGDIYRRQAMLKYEQGEYMESLESLDLVSDYSLWSTQDEALYKKNRELIEKENISFVELDRLGEHYIASIRLNNRITVRMLLDTGASISALDYQFTRSRGMQGNGTKIRLATASGQVDADLFSIQSVEFGGYEIANLEFAGIDLGGNSQYQGLLGMDVLGEFEFYLDQRAAVLYLNAGEKINRSLFGF